MREIRESRLFLFCGKHERGEGDCWKKERREEDQAAEGDGANETVVREEESNEEAVCRGRDWEPLQDMTMTECNNAVDFYRII